MSSKKLPKYWFPAAQLIVGALFSLAIVNFGDAFYAVTATYVAVMLSLISYWLENREVEVIAESQMLAHLSRNDYPIIDNVVGALKINEVLKINKELEKAVFELNSSQLDEYSEKAIETLLENKSGQLYYYAVHLVNEPYYLGIFGNDSPEDEDQKAFVAPQRKLLDKGGEVVRIFIFEPDYFSKNKEKCLAMLARHGEYYKGTKRKVTTLIYRPMHNEQLGNDISVISDLAAFEWIRSTNSKGYINGKCFIKKEDRGGIVDKFNKIRNRAISEKDFVLSVRRNDLLK